MTRRLPLIIATLIMSLAGCAQPASHRRGGLPAPTLALVAAGEPAQPAEEVRGPASSRGAGGYPLEAGVSPTPAPSAAVEPSATAALTATAIPTAAPAATEPPLTPMVQPTASPTTVVATPTAPGTPAPTPKPGPDEPFAYVLTFKPQSDVLLDTVPALPQLRNLSCEAATIRMVLAARGVAASEEEILARMPRSENPHQGFRGDPDGDGHGPGLKDYGVYAEVVAQVLQSFGAPAEAVQGMSEWQLRQAVRGGKAVIVWVTAKEDPTIIEENGYRLVEEEHVYVVVGLLKDGRLLVHDPWGVRADGGRAGTFPVWAVQHWDLFDQQAVVIPLS